jgi:putative membrane protein
MSRRSLVWILSVAMFALALAAPVASARGDRGDRGALGSLDQRFVAFNTRSNLFEIGSGELAQQRAASEDVKNFGAMLVADHTAQQQQLADVAARLGLPVPTDVSRRQAAMLERLASLSGADFDRAFVRAQVVAHIVAIVNNVRLGTNPKLNADLAELAIAGSPVLVRHLREARRLLTAR